MNNLAGVNEADDDIRQELYLAGIPAVDVDKTRSEVPYTVVGKLGNWTFTRAWHYWIAKVDRVELGLPLVRAMELHNRKHPTRDMVLGKLIRSGGHCGCPSPAEYGADPVYNAELDYQLESLGYKKEFHEYLKDWFWHVSVGEISRLCNEGKLTADRYVDCYHIDDQVGLLEFAKAVKSDQ